MSAKIDLSQIELLETLFFQLLDALGGPDLPEDVMKPLGEEVHDLAVALRVAADGLDIGADMLKAGLVTSEGMNEMRQKFGEFQVALSKFGNLEDDAE